MTYALRVILALVGSVACLVCLALFVLAPSRRGGIIAALATLAVAANWLVLIVWP